MRNMLYNKLIEILNNLPSYILNNFGEHLLYVLFRNNFSRSDIMTCDQNNYAK